MSKSKAKRIRMKQVREGRLDPTISRNVWERKPQTQIVKNLKAKERRSYCRSKQEDGALHLVNANTVREEYGAFRVLRLCPLFKRFQAMYRSDACGMQKVDPGNIREHDEI